MRHIIPISGKDSLATAIVQKAREPGLPYEYVFNPTGLELPEVFEWLDDVEKHIGKITRVGRDLLPIITEEFNYFLPSQNARYCTRMSKIEPFIDWVGKEEAIVYYGIRADEERGGFNNTSFPNITPKYPLKEAKIKIQDVYIIVNTFRLKPPTFFWRSMFDMVEKRLKLDVKEALPEWMFDSLFAWRSRTNCDRCFNQRYYEWVGLLEYYPERFWDAESMEHKGGEYTWSSNKKALKTIYEEREMIKQKRADHIVKIIRKTLQTQLFQDDDKDFIDIFSVTSCGLFCGK